MAEMTIGWDIGGAHLKACLIEGGVLRDVAQWPCPLWQGIDHLQRATDAACERWPQQAGACHAVTMTGEMVDLYPDREAGVLGIADQLARRLGERVWFYAGDAGWCQLGEVRRHWSSVASANWLASATLCARRLRDGLLVDIGSTTCDLIGFAGAAVLTRARSDAQRLVSGELVYHGVVRTPLCALAQRVPFRGHMHNVMNEFFATAADVYRLTGELDSAHDQQPSADGGAKDEPATRQRLARMIGLDERDATPGEWLEFAQAWRTLQLAELHANLERASAAYALPRQAPLVAAGCGDFLVSALATSQGRPAFSFAQHVLGLDANTPLARWAQVGAPCIAVARLLDEAPR